MDTLALHGFHAATSPVDLSTTACHVVLCRNLYTSRHGRTCVRPHFFMVFARAAVGHILVDSGRAHLRSNSDDATRAVLLAFGSILGRIDQVVDIPPLQAAEPKKNRRGYTFRFATHHLTPPRPPRPGLLCCRDC